MKRVIYFILIVLFCYSCSLSGDFNLLPTDDTSCWNTEGDVSLDKEEMTLTGSWARAITTSSYQDFILEFDVKTSPNAMGGVFFHCKGYCGLKTGYEVLINNNIESSDWRKTGSLAAIRNVGESVAHNNEWFPMRIEVQNMNIRVYVGDRLVTRYIQPRQSLYRLPEYEKRRLSSGVFVFANHSEAPILFRNIKVKPLDPVVSDEDDDVDEQNDELIRLHQQNIPLS